MGHLSLFSGMFSNGTESESTFSTSHRDRRFVVSLGCSQRTARPLTPRQMMLTLTARNVWLDSSSSCESTLDFSPITKLCLPTGCAWLNPCTRLQTWLLWKHTWPHQMRTR